MILFRPVAVTIDSTRNTKNIQTTLNTVYRRIIQRWHAHVNAYMYTLDYKDVCIQIRDFFNTPMGGINTPPKVG